MRRRSRWCKGPEARTSLHYSGKQRRSGRLRTWGRRDASDSVQGGTSQLWPQGGFFFCFMRRLCRVVEVFFFKQLDPNSIQYVLQLTQGKGTILWLLVFSWKCAAVTAAISECFPHLKGNPFLLRYFLHPPSSPALSNP